MFNKTRFKILVPFFLSFCFSVSQGQASRCELYLSECLNYAEAGSLDITVPVNTTRIARSPLSVCMSGSSEKRAVDFVFAVDMSRSMYGLSTYANDPLFLTPEAVQTAVNYLDAQLGTLAATSNVGFLGFSNGICDGAPALPCVNTDGDVRGAGALCTTHQSTLVKPASFTATKAAIINQASYNINNYHFDCGRLGTNTEYNDALELAGSWLDSLNSPNKQVIIFLTDGSANAGDFTMAVSQFVNDHDSTNFPVVYALFLNPPDILLAPYAYQNLNTLTNKTKGNFYRLDSASQISDIMLEIIQQNIAADPATTTVTNTVNGRTGTAAAHIMTAQGEYSLELDKVVALDSDVVNAVSFSSSANNSNGQSRIVNISVTGPELAVSDTKPDVTPFVLECFAPTRIEFYDAGFTRAIPGGLNFTEDQFGMELQSSSEIPSGQSITLTGGAAGMAPLNSAQRGTATSGKVSGTTISAAWTHPDDPRDRAAGSLPVIDTLPARVFFTDMAGNIITEISDDQSQFKVVVTDELITGAQTIVLTSDDGDRETLTLSPAGANRYEAVVDFRFITQVLTGNQIIEGALDVLADNNAAVVTAALNSESSGSLTLWSGHVPISSVYIIDGDLNGRADSIFIRFVNAKTTVPTDSVTSIDWPEEGGNEFSAAYNPDPGLTEIGFYIGPDGTPDMSLLAVVLKDNGESFEEGATSPVYSAPPTLMYLEGARSILDRVKPVIMKAEKVPSGFERYIDNVTESVLYKPDTLFITLSEAIIADPAHTGNPWADLLFFISEDQVYPVKMRRAPIQMDSLSWKIILSNNPADLNPLAGDEIALNPAAPYADRNGNPPGARYVEIEGRDGYNNTNAAEFMTLVYGSEAFNPGYLKFKSEDISIIDERGNLLETRRIENEISTTNWIPPVQMNGEGMIDPSLPCNTGADLTMQKTFPEGCLSALVILSEQVDGPYTTQVEIYDHLGHYINTLKQDFGRCGEYQNYARMTRTGRFMNPVVWNQRDKDGKLVGNGVYIWMATLTFDTGRTKGHIKKMGVVRNIKMENAQCAGI